MAKTSPAARGLDEIVEKLRDVCRLSGIARALQIGKIVVDGCFFGDASLLRQRRKLTVSYRKLARRADLPVSSSALNRAVGVYELSQRIPWITTSKRLALGHLEAVLPAAEDVQGAMLQQAEDDALSVRAVRSLVRSGHECSGSKRGRPPLHPARRLLTNVGRLTAQCQEILMDCERLGAEVEVVNLVHAKVLELADLCRRFDVAVQPMRKPTAAAA